MEMALVITLIITCVCFTGIWLINVMTEDAGVIDYYWGPGFAVIAAIHLYMRGDGGVFQWVFFAAVFLWAFRLAFHLVGRHNRSTEEDGRYLEMRRTGGPNFWWKSLFTVFTLQAVLLWAIAAPVHVAFSANESPVSGLFWLGMLIFALGFILEWIADVQLERGKAQSKAAEGERVMFTGGLWGKSRHPNYLGEMIVWVGLSLSAYAASGSLIAFAGPVLLISVMIGVSIPLTEQHLLRTRSDYKRYQETVPMLFGFGGRGVAGGSKQPAE